MIVLLLVLAGTALVLYSLFINKIRGLPPGPQPLPFIGNLLQLDDDSVKVFTEWKKKYGKVFTVWMPNPAVVITDHKLLQQHIVKDSEKFSDRINPSELMNFLYGGEYGLIFNDNSIWREQRRFALHTLRNTGMNAAAVEDIATRYSQEIIARWREEGADKMPVDLSQGFMVGIGNITWQQIFGRTLPYDDPLFTRMSDVTKEFFAASVHPLVMLMEMIPALRHLNHFDSPIKHLSEINEGFMRFMIDELELIKKNFNADEEPKCFVDAFMGEMRRREARDEELGTFTEQQLLVVCADLWMAGFESNVTTLRFAFHYMINYPGIQRKAQQEIDGKIGKRPIQMEDQKVLHYCNAIIQEVLRLSSVNMSFARKVTAPVKIEGYDIPAGTGVLPEFSLVHLDPDEFERPEYFCPERHLNEQGEFVKDPRMTPFATGKRSCLGEGLARMELFLYFTSFIQHLRFSPVSKVPPELKVRIDLVKTPEPFDVLVERRYRTAMHNCDT